MISSGRLQGSPSHTEGGTIKVELPTCARSWRMAAPRDGHWQGLGDERVLAAVRQATRARSGRAYAGPKGHAI